LKMPGPRDFVRPLFQIVPPFLRHTFSPADQHDHIRGGFFCCSKRLRGRLPAEPFPQTDVFLEFFFFLSFIVLFGRSPPPEHDPVSCLSGRCKRSCSPHGSRPFHRRKRPFFPSGATKPFSESAMLPSERPFFFADEACSLFFFGHRKGRLFCR